MNFKQLPDRVGLINMMINLTSPPNLGIGKCNVPWDAPYNMQLCSVFASTWVQWSSHKKLYFQGKVDISLQNIFLFNEHLMIKKIYTYIIHIYIYTFPGFQGIFFVHWASLPPLILLTFHPMPGDADPRAATTESLMFLWLNSERMHQPASKMCSERIVLGCNSYDKQGQKPKETYTEPTSTLCGKEKIPYVKLSHTLDPSSSLISFNFRIKSFVVEHQGWKQWKTKSPNMPNK